MASKRLALLLPAGGARAAYQVGVLKYVSEKFPNFQPEVFSGISAGSINACFLAQGTPFPQAAAQLHDLWSDLRFQDVLRTNFRSVFALASRWMYDMFLSKVTRRLLLKSLLDASPLAHTLLTHIHFWKIARAVREGRVKGIAITCTNYHNGHTVVFFDSHEPIEPWRRKDRDAVRTPLRSRHVMASCSIPLLFAPIRIGNHLYGDGALRYNFPFSPAIHLGADRIFAVSIRSQDPIDSLGYRPDHVSLGFIAGTVLNSLFLDSLDPDFENVHRMNRLGDPSAVRHVTPFLVRPSEDLGALSKPHLKEVPFHFRQLIRSTADPEELGDLLSYLMFSPPYLRDLMALGREDAKAKHDDIERFLEEPQQRDTEPQTG